MLWVCTMKMDKDPDFTGEGSDVQEHNRELTLVPHATWLIPLAWVDQAHILLTYSTRTPFAGDQQ